MSNRSDANLYENDPAYAGFFNAIILSALKCFCFSVGNPV
ncbi:hypothetical protein HMPREF1992_02183 [Selenomonas sp. oral taxon 892 str. F0426]|nr:hypothetical protein HMPREF1992_02183 [Selenomonas sp. oral taxon 892 str. F0426]